MTSLINFEAGYAHWVTGSTKGSWSRIARVQAAIYSPEANGGTPLLLVQNQETILERLELVSSQTRVIMTKKGLCFNRTSAVFILHVLGIT